AGAMRSDWPTSGAAVIRNSDAKLQQHRRSLSIRTVQNRDPLGGSLGDGIVRRLRVLCCDERHMEAVDFKRLSTPRTLRFAEKKLSKSLGLPGVLGVELVLCLGFVKG
ncbi:MAG: hypothetical protein WB729_00005, partial [Candidatus Sulfotelmatobacter sp.]